MILPPAKSALINVLLRVITAPDMHWDVVASAGELIALDMRFNHWFLTVAKQRASFDELLRLLELSDKTTIDVEQAWTRFDASPERSVDELRARLADGCQSFRNVIIDVSTSKG